MRSIFSYYLYGHLVINLLNAEVRVNEIMASNTRAYPDITDFEDYPDWIEIFNESTEGLSLEGYFLSDDTSSPFKWRFPDDATISAGEHLVIITDGNDAPLGATFRRTYWPFYEFQTEKHHTNFSLSSSGEAVVLTKYATIQNESLIPREAVWKYLDDGSERLELWRSLAYDDSSWGVGPAPLGYGDSPATELSFGGDPENRHITSYFRHQFLVSDPSRFAKMTLQLQVDDGAYVFLNEQLLISHNMPGGDPNYLTTASQAVEAGAEEFFHTYSVSPELLLDGNNILTVEVHQAAADSDDLRFDLELETVAYSNPVELDRVIFPTQVTDVSLGRDPSDENSWVYFTNSTPGTVNGGSLVNDLLQEAGKASLSPLPGVFDEAQTVALNASQGAIHFTLDGKDPDEDDPVYTMPIELTQSAVVRARVIESGKVPGPVITGTYLIGESFAEETAFLSVVAEPEALFDDRIGIYYNQHEPLIKIGPAVYKKKDAPGNLELFPADRSAGFSVNGSFRMGAENNWANHFQRTLNFATRGKYGDDSLKYNVFPGRPIPEFTALAIREGGDDYGLTRMADALFDRIAHGRLEVDGNKSRSTEVFVNAQYWGHYNLRGRWDEEWFFQHYGVDRGAYDQVRLNSRLESAMVVEHGSVDEWVEFYDFVKGADMSDPTVWEFIESRIDVDSFIDFLSASIYSDNTGWPNGRELWKAHRAGSRWRWLLPDMDLIFRVRNSNEITDMYFNEQLFKYLRNNQGFKERFAQRFSAHLATTFAVDRIHGLLDEMTDEIIPTLDRTRDRWGEEVRNPERFLAGVGLKKFYASTRANEVPVELRQRFGFSEQVPFTFQATGEGWLKIAGVDVPPMTLSLFPGMESEIEAVPAPGYEFTGWTGAQGGAKTTLSLDGESTLTAHFSPLSTTPLGGPLTQNLTLLAGETYDVSSDLIVPEGITLTIPEGASLRLDPGVHLRVMGVLNVVGTEGNPVTITNRLSESWGGLSFETPALPSSLNHLVMRGATRGEDPLTYPAGIAGLDATLSISHLDISGERGPLFFRGGSLELRDSQIDIPITGDGINVKQGAAITERCVFTGNDSPDTDAIDYDGVVDGIIRDCRIYNFRGFNSDGIDTGEQCVNCLIERNTIYFNSDKGISVGQGSDVVARFNVIVGCAQGVGIKDSGSTILLDRNTFVDCAEGVAVFEKNFASGGGNAVVKNTIFSGCEKPVTVDALSSLTVSYSLSDTQVLPGGTGNLLADPQFVDRSGLDFSLQSSSPAIDSGDPSDPAESDGTQVDQGAAYQFSPDDYPFLSADAIVINEILANSGPDTGDWIELHNRTQRAIDLSGWFLSDDGSALEKYQFPPNTILQEGGFLLVTEAENFGHAALDPGRLTGFALSDTGETLHLSSPTGYLEREDYGPSDEGVTIGTYFRPSRQIDHFLSLSAASPGQENGIPAVGPIIFSEIMPAPLGNSAAEYLELVNISATPVTFYDEAKDLSWKFTDGIEFSFPSESPITLNPNERIILTRSIAAFHAEFSPPPETQVYQWTSGKLANEGERIQLSKPGPLTGLSVPTFIRVERVSYETTFPWPEIGNSSSASIRQSESSYGDDFENWKAATATPGEISFEAWLASHGVTDPEGDSDNDQLKNIIEYALDTDPTVVNHDVPLTIEQSENQVDLTFANTILKPDLAVILQKSADLENWDSIPFIEDGDQQRAIHPMVIQQYYRLKMTTR